MIVDDNKKLVGMLTLSDILGYLLLTCELLIVHLGRSRSVRWFLLLPLIFAVWVNCHGSFFLGAVILVVVAVWGAFVSVR